MQFKTGSLLLVLLATLALAGCAKPDDDRTGKESGSAEQSTPSSSRAEAEANNPDLPYKLINPAGGTEQPEVVEFFSFTCPHCRAMEGFLADWLPKKPANVQFRRMHVVGMFGEQGDLLAKAFYTAEVLGIEAKIHQPFFDLIHLERKMPKNEQEVAAYFANFGVSADTVLSTMNSFPVSMKMGQAKQAVAKYKLTGVPGFIINDKYFTDGSTAKSAEALDKVLTELPLR
ncbi:thiol:disulfide interchange protein DsbA/DsbL [Permianibacter sp. IMCC34836]|uniref:thiol:disulfide interchange protein DsbA/DsbL n=1 Tax=Permianibacter fluminis TaxID=2738515 RepID=UPI0015545EE9|nr:thiol:disulfide interchange protein DsbA/DsbL [Permianibacter fluminis]NQD36058.1 thiol:disulfide interchange protein DsbA/DsbL [Permianibacter fluminis]